ncbi:MAG: TRAP transporter small permease [Paracoccaceae bacterium]|nr:TRAP transporter small permease [Paracoccaceae bacterium]
MSNAVQTERPRVLRAVERISTMLALGAGITIALLAVLITIDIVGRDVFGVSVQGTDEIGGYVLAFVGSLGMALTLMRRGHPRIDLFFRFFPNAVRDTLNVLAQITIAGFAVFMAWQAWGELEKTLRFGAITNTPLQTPLWVPQSIWLAGMIFFALTCCLTSAHAIWLYFTDRRAVSLFYGSPSVAEEVEQYVDTKERNSHDARD